MTYSLETIHTARVFGEEWSLCSLAESKRLVERWQEAGLGDPPRDWLDWIEEREKWRRENP